MVENRIAVPACLGVNGKARAPFSTRRAALALMMAVCLLLGGCNSTPTGPRLPATPVFYPPLPQKPRIQFLCTLSGAADVEPPPGFLERFIVGQSKEDVAARTIARPYGLTLWNGELYVCDTGGSKAAVFDLKRRRFKAFGQTGDQRLQTPINVSVSPDGTKFITDTKAGLILKFDRNNDPAGAVTTSEKITPCDVIWREGELFVSDLKNSTVWVMDPADGRILRRIGQYGSKLGQLRKPTNIAFGPNGRLYVCDTLSACVQVFDAKGTPLRTISSPGTALGRMVRPRGIAVDREGRLYVADAATDSVQLFDSADRLLLMLGETGHGPGDMVLPSKVSISYDGVKYFARYASPDFRVEYVIFVTNQLGPNKINVYGFGSYTGPEPVGRPGESNRAPAAALGTAEGS